MLVLRLRVVCVWVVVRNVFALIVSSDVSRLYCVGFVLCVCGFVQVVSGVGVGVVYVWCGVGCGFWSLVVLWDVVCGWCLRVVHSVGTSVVFGGVFWHVVRVGLVSVGGCGGGGGVVV